METKIIYLENGSVTSAKGYEASGIHCGLKKKNKDLALILSTVPAVSAGVYTTNKAAAAPVVISKKITDGSSNVKAIICNSGNANACTGVDGHLDALEVQKKCAKILDVNQNEVLVSSTGVIGVRLNVPAIVNSLNILKDNLSKDGGLTAAEAIMTTDTVSKHFAVKVELSGGKITIGGIAKGSGMIMPNMATMLGFVTTDAKISKNLLQSALKEAVNDSYNKISVDGETSTNDMVLMMANGMSQVEIKESSEDYSIFTSALKDLSIKMAKSIVFDGEGATKFITINIKNAPTEKDANLIAKSIANSPLVKTAINGGDPNWGRVISAASSCGADIKPANCTLSFNDLAVLEPGYKIDYSEEEAAKIFAQKNFVITLDLNDGNANTTWWTCDYSEQYIKINAHYRT
ncbi:MAG: bifunctional glutamate N-acetyltransferase/amino-acid acetyltransferase ArgJ [Ignavibacteriales bacterium]|nr:bifunctional glutamate N-acetyltransferase/amino-acid acetyltransferase ArgJ [Ignavibacteriales bacterium]MCB9257778.1 bifunctional glutamate N-acetyltransferase/amino-acid acetyltransferase ArgJ [Ignavibacteriales bacterium]